LKSALELPNVLWAEHFLSATHGQPADDCIEETDVAVSHLGKTIKRSNNLDGARVGIIVKPSAEFVASVWATWICGIVAVPLALSYPKA
jgi:acyl-CoA synthetase (AMP-forming)/AMP-acid ligase II